MSLEEYILTYRGTTDSGTEGIVCNIPDYYERYVKPLEKRFFEYNFYGSKTVICCFHNDTDPSLGLINHRFLSDVKIYHCFGCGTSGTVIRMHQVVQETYFKRVLTTDEACKELASLFNISLDDFDDIAEDDYEGKYVSMLKRINKLQSTYTSTEFSRDLLDLRKNQSLSEDDKLRLVNVEIVKMVATQKRLYN